MTDETPQPAATAPSTDPENMLGPRSLPYAFFATGLTVLVFFILWVTQSILVPLVTAIFFAFLIISVKKVMDRIPLVGPYLPNAFKFILAFAVMALVLIVLALLVRDNIEAVIAKAPEYGAQFQIIAEELVRRAEGIPLISEDLVKAAAEIVQGIGSGIAMDETDAETLAAAENLREQAFSFVRGVITSFTAAAGGLVGSLITTFLYTAFILIERGRFLKKLTAIAPQEDGRRHFIDEILDDIGHLVRTYITVKTAINLFVAFVSYVLMRILQTDFAGFWALMIFAFGFVPIVGAAIAISLPTLLTLVQPEHGGVARALLTMACLIGAEQSMSSFIEPRLIGRSLNLSPLIILLSLAIWGALWGFPGMLLCIPITVSLLIVLSQFNITRPIAVMISDNGQIAAVRRGMTDVEEKRLNRQSAAP